MDYLPAVAGPIRKSKAARLRASRPLNRRVISDNKILNKRRILYGDAEATHEKELKLLPNDEGAKQVERLRAPAIVEMRFRNPMDSVLPSVKPIAKAQR